MLNGALEILKALAIPHAAFDGAVTFYMLPFSSIHRDTVIWDLERIRPKQRWVNTQTKETVLVIPEEYRLVMEAASAVGGSPAYTEWEEEYLWRGGEHAFIELAGSCIDVEFDATASISPSLLGLKMYWEKRTGDVQHDWELFQYTIHAGEVATAIHTAYEQTRRGSLSTPATNSEAAPNPEA